MSEVVNKIDKVRVLVVDDSAVIRRIISSALAKCDDIEVVGTAANGLLAISFLKENKVDIVTLDIEMPEMDGLTALNEIRKFERDLPIIMFSTLTQRGANATIQALTSGASDYVSKPTGAGDISEAFKVLEELLIPKIRSLAARGRSRFNRAIVQNSIPIPVQSAPVTIRSNKPLQAIEAICIGISTGGPAALMYIFESIKRPLPVPIFIVQHMPPKFTEILSNRLTEIGVIPVEEPYEGQEAMPGKAYIAPGGRHMALQRQGSKVIMKINDDPPENSCRPAADILFRTAANVYGSKLLAAVLTGMGSDGLNGSIEVVNKSGCVIAQDEESSVVWGMPGAVVKANLVDGIYALNDIPTELFRRATI